MKDTAEFKRPRCKDSAELKGPRVCKDKKDADFDGPTAKFMSERKADINKREKERGKY